MSVTQKNLFDRVLDYANRANPYPIYEEMRKQPVARQDDGRYVVSTFNEVRAALLDPRFSVDARKGDLKLDRPLAYQQEPAFVRLDPPRHDQLRRQVMSKFTPELVSGLAPRIEEIVQDLLDRLRNERQLDIVEDFAYPLPVTIICEILGVPREDEPRFHEWTERLIKGFDVGQRANEELRTQANQASEQLNSYMRDLITRIQQQPRDGLLSAIIHDKRSKERMSTDDLVRTAVLLLIAGHETTVNLITNSMLTLLRFPEHLEGLQREPENVPNLVEEVLRYEPPVQYVLRNTLTDVTLANVKIPRGSSVALMLAAANRDPARYADPNRFDPTRKNIEHLSFGNGIHYCVGAPLARLEAQIALVALAHRLIHPRLLSDPPPYRASSLLRGPRHLPVSVERVLSIV